MLAEAEHLAADADPNAPEVFSETDSEIVRSIFHLHRTSEIFSRVCEDPRLIVAARQLLGSDVYLHQSRINYKPAFDGKDYFWHSDFETWHVEDGMPRMRAVIGPPGPALIFECNTMHGSAGNLSPYPRVNFFAVFSSVENLVVEPFGHRPPRPEYLAERRVTLLCSQAS